MRAQPWQASLFQARAPIRQDTAGESSDVSQVDGVGHRDGASC